MILISWQRLLAVIVKEFIQMRRDRVTFAMIIMIPLIQLMLFGFAINTNPKYLPTAVLAADQSDFTRTIVRSLENTEYFRINPKITTEKAAHKALALGRTQFIVSIPPNFTRDLLRGERPQILLEADATDPVATGSAIAAIRSLAQQNIFSSLLTSNLQFTQYYAAKSPIELVVHPAYNPENITQYNIVPGLLGVVLTMTMVVITSMCMTRERERGTMENLLATPVRPLEVIIGKIAPYIIVGYIQLVLILLASRFIFQVPMQGSVWLLVLVSLPFIAANLSVGLTFSSLATNQLQAAQLAMFFFLPSLLLSGFMFPFYGMPQWAQTLGSILPLTHFLRIVRGIVLKGNGFSLVWHDLWQILTFMVVAVGVGVKRYRKTLD
ncbi:MAG: ABC transporter permease [Gammaproteobacteria bacterium]